jgi:hypothetical protein
MRLSSLIPTWALAVAVIAVDSVVDLGYSKYEGTALLNGVSQWLGIRYAVSSLAFSINSTALI